MATIYVSDPTTATNLVAGSDSNNGLTAGAPKATIAAAMTAAGAGGTLIIDGTFALSGSSYHDLQIGTLTINAYVNYAGTLQSGASATRVIRVANTAAGLTLGKIVVDARGVNANCIDGEAAVDINGVTLNGTKLLNPTQAFVTGNRMYNFTADSYIATATAATVTGFVIGGNPGTAGTVTITNGTITIAGITSSRNVISLPGPAGVGFTTVTISGNTINITPSAVGNTVNAISVTGAVTVNIHDNTITGVVGTGISGIVVPNHATISCTSCHIYNNTISPSANASGGSYGIRVGDDSAPTTNTITGTLVYGNTVTSANHGILFGNITGGICYGNTIYNVVLGVIGKSTTSCRFMGNVLKQVNGATSGAIRSKGGTSDQFIGNTHIVTSGYNNESLYATNNGAGNNCSGVLFKNNLVYGSGVNPVSFVSIDASQTVSLANNCYYPISGTNMFTYQGSSYSNLAAWQAVETTAISGDPLFQSSTDYRLSVGSPCLRAGAGVFGLKDFRGRRRPLPPSIGAYEPTSRDVVTVARTARA